MKKRDAWVALKESHAELERKLEQRTAELKESLEQQTATAEILKVISSSPTDVQPIFDAIAKSALRLIGGLSVVVSKVDGSMLSLGAFTSTDPSGDQVVRDFFPVSLSESSIPRHVVSSRSTIEIADVDTDPRMSDEAREFAHARGWHSQLAVPMIRDDEIIGIIHVTRQESGSFSDHQVGLIKTFADQAVIAIENVRLFNETKEALERQTATAEILKVISSSPTDVQPVCEAIASSTARLMGDCRASVWRAEHGIMRPVAFSHPDEKSEELKRLYPTPLDGDALIGRVLLDRGTLHVPDVFQSNFEKGKRVAKLRGFRAFLGVPLMLDGEAVGAIAAVRVQPGEFSPKQVALLETFAAQAVIAIQNVRLFNETKEALERQTATAEILKVISSSPTDAQPVFEAIVKSGARLISNSQTGVFLTHNGTYRPLAFSHPEAITEEARNLYPAPLTRESIHGRAIFNAATIFCPDMLNDPFETTRRFSELTNLRSCLIVPMMRDGVAIGTIGVGRKQPGEFSPKQISLIETFADQAVIAIENVRLFNETKEALEQQTATNQILRAISGSPTDIAPVFDAILENAIGLCGGDVAVLWQYDGRVLRAVAGKNIPPNAEAPPHLALGAYNPTPQAGLERRTVHVLDVFAEPGYRPLLPAGTMKERPNAPTVLAVPLLRESELLGVITIWRFEKRLFTEKQVEMVNTFAAQAVIAIDNARLFTEIQEALDQQTATAEILRVISGSPTDVQPVFEAILESAGRLFNSPIAAAFRYDGQLVHLVATRGWSAEAIEDARRYYPGAPDSGRMSGRVILAAKVLTQEDAQSDPSYVKSTSTARNWRRMLAAPMLKDGAPVGAIVVAWPDPGKTPDKHVALLKTFADQAVIAIENVRLFNETKEALERQTATSQILRAISGSPNDIAPVFHTILENAIVLCGGDVAGLWQYDGRVLRFAAGKNTTRQAEALLHQNPLELGTYNPTPQAGLQQRTVHVLDVFSEPGYRALVPPGTTNERPNAPTVLAVPLLRESELLGVITIWRYEKRLFSEKQVEMVNTFAAQAVIAIDNVRLFHEIEDKSRQLEIAGKHKSDFLANMSHELRTPLNAIIGFSEVLLERMFGEMNEKQEDYLKDIRSSGQHLLALINDILDLAKVEAGRMELNLAAFDLPAAIDNALILIRERALRHGISLSTEVDPQLGALIADERKLKQILLNLLSNAVKFTPQGGKIKVGARLLGDMVEIAVSDTGIGIALKDQAIVFEEFKQVGTDYTRKAEGTGLGLALTRKFVELHGGAMRLDSEPGKGSTFYFTLPLNIAAPRAAQTSA